MQNSFLLGFLERNQKLRSHCQVGSHMPALKNSKGSLLSRPVLPLFVQYTQRERKKEDSGASFILYVTRWRVLLNF